jgi:alkaline phosphatase D
MSYSKVLALVLVLTTCMFSNAQKAKIFSGPIVGSVTKNSAKVWSGYRGKGKQILVLTDTISNRIFYPSSVSEIRSKTDKRAAIASFTQLVPNRRYFVVASIEKGKKNATSSFVTLPDSGILDFSFTLGSCALLETGFWRGAFPGGSSRIFCSMEKKKPNFMLWLGDNLYYFKRDYVSYEKMFARNMNIRSRFKPLNHFLLSTPQYAIWDDHDYGPNDSGKSWQKKDTSLVVFKHFWPNTYPHKEQLNGNYFSYVQHDAEFFMLDNRSFRDEPCDTCSFLGETQLVWLKNKLQLSDATFKFIAVGTQVLNANGFGESYEQYQKEHNDLINFITQNNIKGVVFLTGDKHYSEVCKRIINRYPVYDFTCSPLTTPALPRKILGAYHNADRIEGSDYARKNFGKISISGSVGNRIATLEIFSVGGKLKRTIVIPASGLQQQ